VQETRFCRMTHYLLLEQFIFARLACTRNRLFTPLSSHRHLRRRDFRSRRAALGRRCKEA
jgi:hypothetical protein